MCAMSEVSVDLRLVPLTCVQEKTVVMLSYGLDSRKVLPAAESGLNRDWRGLLATSCLASCQQDVANLAKCDSPTKALFHMWKRAQLAQANVRLLLDSLALIDRFDVLNDVTPLIKSDVEQYLNRIDKIVDRGPIQRTQFVDDAVTNQDGYDAFILYADEDYLFAEELIKNMENCGFSLCLKERDLLGGVTSVHSAVMQLISDVRTRLIVILSPDLIKSPFNRFIIEFAQALGIEQQRRIIIPCIYKECIIPPQLAHYFLLRYQRSGKHWNFWDRLRNSLKASPYMLPVTYNESIREIESQTSALMVNSGAAISVPPDTPIICNGLTVPSRNMSASLNELNNNTNDTSNSISNSSNIVSMSVNDLNNLMVDEGSSRNEKLKKKKWYNILPSNSSKNLELCNQAPNVKKRNKKWNLKKRILSLAN